MNDNMSLYKPDWLEAKERMTDWWAGKKADRAVARIIAPAKRIKPDIGDKTDDPVFLNLENEIKSVFWGGEAFPFHNICIGPMYDQLVYYGAKPIFTKETTWYESHFKSLDEIIEYKPETDGNKWWQDLIDLVKKSAERSKGRYLVSVSGVAAVIDMLAYLIGNEELLLAMKDEPEKVIAARNAVVKHCAPTFDERFNISNECNDEGSIDWIGVWAPGKFITNQCDLSVMISPEMFDKFVFDELNAVCLMHNQGAYHLDGEDQIKHLDSILKLHNIKLIQWVPATKANDPNYVDPLNWIGLFKRIQNAGCRVYISTPCEKIKELLNKIDRDLVYLSTWCPDEETAAQVLRDLK